MNNALHLERRSSSSPPPPPPARPIELGRFEVLAELASGGTGTVYLARLSGIGGFERLFAVKVLHKHLADQQEVVDMLLKEARLTSHIQHPHVVDTVEVGVTDAGAHYLVMAYVEGVSLDDLLEHPTLDAVGRVRLGLPILLDAMSGLDAAHHAKDATTGEPLGIVHRDVSPANILIGMDGIGRVADFGIASARAHSAVSEPGLVRGTPRYMAPEQTQGGAIDPRADVFALGAVLWEIITGEPLFDSRISVEHILTQVATATIPPPSDRNSRISAELDAVCLRALQRNVDERYESVAQFRDALAQIADANGLLATPRELIDELARLFGDRVERRRSLIRRASGRKSGTRLRAISDTQLGMTPLRDAAADSVARASSPRSSVTATQIGIRPLVPPAQIDPNVTLEQLMAGDDDEDEQRTGEHERAYRLPRKHWRRWAVLVLALAGVLGAWQLWGETFASSAEPAPRAEARAQQPAPEPRAAASGPVEVDLEEPATTPVAAKPAARMWKAPVKRASSAAAATSAASSHSSSEAPASAAALPLEPNPYLLQR